MGLLSSLFDRKGNDKSADLAEALEENARIEKEPECGSLGAIHLEGDRVATAYIYDGRPLKKIKEGEVFSLDTIPTHVTIRSTLTGGTWSSLNDDGIPLGYGGRPVGFTNGSCDDIRKLLDMGYAVTIAARCNGMYDKGIPDVVVMLPPREEIRALFDPEQKAWNDGLIFSYNVYEENDAMHSIAGENEKLAVEVKMLPVEKGSSAKPKIALMDGDKAVDEFGARSKRYKTFVEHVGKVVKISVTKRAKSLDDGDYYHVEVDLR